MNTTTRRARRSFALMLVVILVPTIAHADDNDGFFAAVDTTFREIDEAGGVPAYLWTQVKDHAESGAKSVLSMLPGNADDVADAGQHTYSFMDRADKQIKHMIDTGTTDGVDQFWSETTNQAGGILYDKFVPEVLKEGIDKVREIGENLNWLAEKGKDLLQQGGDSNDGLSALDGYLGKGGIDLPGNGGYRTSDFDQVLRDLGEAPTPTGNELNDLSDAAGSSMAGGDTYSGYDVASNGGGGSFSDSFQASTAKAFKQADAQAKTLIDSSQPPSSSSPVTSSVDAVTSVANSTSADCDPRIVLARVKDLLPTGAELNRHDSDPCGAPRSMIDVAKRQLAVFAGCSVDGPLGAINVPVQKLMDKAKAELQACLGRQKPRPAEEDPGGPHCIDVVSCAVKDTKLRNCEIGSCYPCLKWTRVTKCN